MADDPCGEIDFTDPAHVTQDGEQQIALVLFADVDFTDPDQVIRRRLEWEELGDA